MVSLTEFLKRSDAELVCGNIIVGLLEDRRVVGHTEDGTYFLNDEGHKILQAIEAGDADPVKPKVKRKPTENAGKTHEDYISGLDKELAL
jgi:hypothetical protein